LGTNETVELHTDNIWDPHVATATFMGGISDSIQEKALQMV
jgi:hypothetical protein